MTTVLGREEIEAILPHREPFLLIDEIVELEPGERVVARKTVRPDEWYLAGLEGKRAGRVDYTAVVHATFADVTRAQEAADSRLLAFCDVLTPSRLGAVAEWSDADGDVHAEPVHLVLAHLFVHQIHHRGQVHDLLLRAGIRPPQLDEFFLRGDAPRRAEELRRLGLEDPTAPRSR